MSVASLSVNVKANTASFTSSMDRAKSAAKQAMAETRKEVTESNHSLALFGETFGVGIPRHIRTFVSELPGVSAAMSAAFDGLAIVLLAKVLIEAAEKAYEFGQAITGTGEKSKEAREKAAEAFEAITTDIHTSNDELALTDIRLKNAIAKLEGKPQNGLAEALAEANVEANKLFKSLDEVVKKEVEALKSSNATAFSQAIIGNAGNESLQKIFTDYKADIDKIKEEYYGRTHNGSDEEKKTASDEMNSEIHARTATGLTTATNYQTWLQGEQNRYNKLKTLPWYDDTTGLAYDQSAVLPQSKSQVDLFRSLLDQQNMSSSIVQDKATERGVQGKKDAGAAARKAAEEQKRLDEDQWKQIEENALRTADGHKKSLAEQVAYWDSVTQVRAGNALKLRDKKADVHDEDDVQDMAALNAYYNKTEAAAKVASRAIDEFNKAVREGSKQAAELTGKQIAWSEHTGQISQADAAMQRMTAHTQEYLTAIRMLNRERADILTDQTLTPEQRSAKLRANGNSVTSTIGNYELQHAQDVDSAGSLTAKGAVKDFWRTMVDESQNSSKAIITTMLQAQRGVNAQISDLITGQKTSWSSLFRQLGTDLINMSLTKLEGSSIVSGIGKTLGSALHIPGYADGGDPDPYRTSIVGENGPELFTPRGVSGHITSNRDLRTMATAGGVVYQVGNINASGANQAEVEMRVQRGMVLAHNQAVKTSTQQLREQSLRRPSRTR